MTVNVRYEIDENENFAIRVWDLDNPNEDNAPFFYQPEWPLGMAWASYAEAETWVKALIAQREDITNGGPGVSPDKPFIPYDPEKDTTLLAQKAKEKALDAGLTEKEISLLKFS